MAEKKVRFNVKDFENMNDKEFHLYVIDPFSMVGRTSGIMGSLDEVVSRQPHQLNVYSLAQVKSIEYEDGTRPAIGDALFRGSHSHIFNLDSVDVKKAILNGSLAPFELHDNTVGQPLDKKVVLYLGKVNKYKERQGMACF